MKPGELWVGSNEEMQKGGSKITNKTIKSWASLTGGHVISAFINVKCSNCEGDISFGQ